MAGPRQPLDLLLYKKQNGGGKHLTKKEIEDRRKSEIKANHDKVKPPEYLPKELRKTFNNITRELMEIGIITNLDVDSLARFVILQNQWETLTQKILEVDPIEDFGYYNELSKTQERLTKQVRSASSDLGLTISSRCKLVVPKKEEPKKKSKEEELFGDV